MDTKFYVITKKEEKGYQLAFIRNTSIPLIFSNKKTAESQLKKSKIEGYEVRDAIIMIK